MRRRSFNKDGNDSFVHPWAPHERALRTWIKMTCRKRPRDRVRLKAVVNSFYPAVIQSADAILKRPEYRRLQLDGVDIAGMWYARLVERKFKGYDRRRPFYPWGYRVLIRTCQSVRRYESYRCGTCLTFDVPARESEPEVADEDEEYVQLWQAIRELPEIAQVAVIRKHIKGERSADIACDFGMNAAQFNLYTHKLRNRLRRTLENDRSQEGRSL
jgi:DNA-directed RNA polymerase specialized sigma24 family protein